MRRARLLLGGALAVALLGPGLPPPSAAQGQAPQGQAPQGQAPAAEARPVDPVRFLGFARSSAVLQERASRLAASKDTRPEVREFAREMAQFRGQQLERLQAFARQRGLSLPAGEEFEHRVVLENLEPLDYLALSRRYAEVQLQALEQEIRGYEAAAQAPDADIRNFAAETLPQLRQRLDAARRMHDAVKPSR